MNQRPSGSEYHCAALAAWRQADFESALQFWLDASTSDPKDGDWYYWLGACYERLGQPEQAISCYRMASTLPKPELSSNLRLARAFANLGQASDALQIYQYITSLDSKNFGYVEEALHILDDRCGREVVSSKVREIEAWVSTDEASRHQYVMLLFDFGLFREAEKICLKMLNRAPHPDWYVRLSAAQKNLGKYEDAYRTTVTAGELDPRDWTIQETIGDLGLTLGKLTEAERAYNTAVCLCPSEPAYTDWHIILRCKLAKVYALKLDDSSSTIQLEYAADLCAEKARLLALAPTNDAGSKEQFDHYRVLVEWLRTHDQQWIRSWDPGDRLKIPLEYNNFVKPGS